MLLVGAVQSSHAQSERFEVNGSVVDSTLIGIPSATVVALTRADSVLTKFGVKGFYNDDNRHAF